MIENTTADKTMVFFFRCMGYGMIISALRIDINRLTLTEIASYLLITVPFNFMNAIQIGIFGVLSLPVFLFLKKKIEQ